MSKYKLLKRYPSLPKSWKVGEIVEQSYGPHCYSSTRDNINYRINIPKEEVENNPEFWEKVEEEKEYEILSFKKRRNGKITKVKNFSMEKGGYLWDFDKNEFYPSKDFSDYILKYFNIHSVKRLSDNEIFTVGDKITYINCKAVRTITKFIIEEDNSLIVKGKHRNGRCSYHINHVEKSKQPILTTEDGVDIYEGDSYCFIEPYTFYAQASIAPDKNDWKHNTIRFKKKEKAEEWIEDNKPKYSKKDVMKIVDKSLNLCWCARELLHGEEYVIDLAKLKKQLNG